MLILLQGAGLILVFLGGWLIGRGSPPRGSFIKLWGGLALSVLGLAVHMLPYVTSS